MKQEVKIGQTDYTVLILVRDSTTGAPKTALTFESAGIDVCYVRVETDNDVVLTDGAPVTTTLTGSHVDWGFVLVDDTKAPGLYKLDIADGVFATGAWSAVVSFICTGCDPVHIEFVLVPDAPYDGVKVKSITDNAITATAINADAITNAKIADDAIAVENIKDAAITAAKIASDAIEAAKIKDDAITAAKIAAGAIDNATFAADVGSTAYATNIIALAVRKVLDEIKLDHLVAVADADDVADNSIMAKLAATSGDWSTFVDTTDSLQSIRDKLPANLEDMSIVDTTGLVDITQTAADKVWGTAARVLTANTNLANLEVDLTKIHGTALTETAGQLAAAFTKMFDVATPVLTCESVNQAQDNATVAEIADAVWDEAIGDHGGAGVTGKAVADILADTNELQVDDYPTSIAAVKTVVDLIEDIVRNQMDITDATGAASLKNDAGVEMLTATVTDNSTTTTRTRLA